jgi:CRISPR-associated protein Cas5d
LGNYDIAVKVWGDLACFTRPEFKVERVTYRAITPSAARGVLEAIFWKPKFRWEIREIWILNPIEELVIMRNEVDSRQSPDTAGFVVEDRRQQRTGLFLKKPSYLIFADVRLKKGTEHPKKKYTEQFLRRAERGQCYHQPYLGTRECSAYFSLPQGNEKPVSTSIILGNMLFDIAYCQSSKRTDMSFFSHKDNAAQVVYGFAQPLFFQAKVENGVLRVPLEKYKELYSLEGIHVKGIS